MAHDEIPLVGDGSSSPSMALLPANGAEHSNGEWNNAVALMQPPAPPASDLDPMAYVHALRRHWLMAVGIGLLCAGVAGPAVWFAVGSKYVATSFLRVSMQTQGILTDEQQVADRDRFEIYKNTQQELVHSRFVLLAALRRPDVAKLPSVQEATQEGDVTVWLLKYLSISFPGRAELMEVDVTRNNPDEAAALARAVVDAYLKEVVYAEQGLKQQRLSELDRAFGEKQTENRSMREELKKLAEQLGASATEMLTLKQKLALEELSTLRTQLAQATFEVQRLKGDLAAQQALLKATDTSEMLEMDMNLAIQTDPIAKQLSLELAWRKMDQVYMESAVVANAQSRYASHYQQDLKMIQQQYDARRAELADMVRQQKRSVIQAEVERLSATVAVRSEQAHGLQEDVQKQQTEAGKFGSSSVDLEMLVAQVKNSDLAMTGISAEREKLRVEIRATPRVTLLQQAEAPIEAANAMARIGMTLLAMLFGFFSPAAVVMLLDVRAKHINNSGDVSKGLRLPVIGSVPLIPARIIRRLGSPEKRYQTWQVRLTESVDGIAARVLRKAEMEQCRVIMVSSAAGGEGKTTLATQLALSLARAGRRTVLVDFDLRRPAFDEIFGLPLEPGVCEALRDKNAVSVLVHEADTQNLSIVTAGRWDRSALASLSNGAAAALFKQLRGEYDFVVVDTSPILPVADARFISQHVDSVVLSIFRDVSEAPKIQAACEILSAFGVHTVEAVVTGQNSNMYGGHMGYESTISA